MKKISENELQQLIQENTGESVCVDFKQEWHNNNALLVHDILCLSNADYKGDRFILIGVNDDAEILGVNPKEDSNRKDDAKIFDLLRQSNLNRLPEIDVYTLSINQKDIDIIHIANEMHKPFFLTKDKSCQKEVIRAGTVYSRNGSSNTPKNSTSGEAEIEKMWRERFWLNQTPYERFNHYLLDANKWEKNSNGDYYYSLFPEFKVREIELERTLEWDHEWTRGEIGYHYTNGNSAYAVGIYYNETLLDNIHVVVFDEIKKTIVAPFWEPINRGRFYFYKKNSLQYSYQKYLSNSQTDHSRGIRKTGGRGYYDIPVFEDDQMLEDFLQFVGKEETTTDPEMDKQEQNNIFYNLLDKYQDWKIKITQIQND